MSTMNVVEVHRSHVHELLKDRTTVGAGSSFLKPTTRIALQAYGNVSSGTGSAEIDVEVSLDDIHWIVLGQISLTLGTTAVTDGFVSEAPWRYIRGNVKTLSGTGAKVSLLLGV